MANWASTERLGDPSQAAWQTENLDTIDVGGQKWRVYKPARAAFEGLLNDLVKAGYNPLSSGGFNYRTIRGSDKLSQHAFGTAIDLNAATNALGSNVSDIPQAAELAKKWGLDWGGNWKGRPDPMHFEYQGSAQGTGGAGVAPAAAVAPAPARSVGGAGVVPVGAPPAVVGDEAVVPAAPAPAAAPVAPETDQPMNWMELIAKNVKGMGGGGGPGVQMSRAQHPGASIVDAPAPQAPVMPVGGMDPAKREQLAMIMQRLNQRTLF